MTENTKAAHDQAPIQSGELAELRALAKAASPGPWRGDRYDGTVKYDLLDANDEPVISGDNGNSDCGPYGIRGEADEKYLIAVNPATILRLLDALAAVPAAQQQAQSVPTGWKLVPIEPTDEMRIACPCHEYFSDIDADWAAMLAAAPTPPASQQQEQSCDDESYELVQDDMIVAVTSGRNALAEMRRYAAQYEQDGPVEIFKCSRTTIYATPQGERETEQKQGA